MEINMLHILKMSGILCVLASISLLVMKFALQVELKTVPILLILIITAVVLILGYTNILEK